MFLHLYLNTEALNHSSRITWGLLHLFCVRCLSSLFHSLRNLPALALENQLGLRHRHKLCLLYDSPMTFLPAYPWSGFVLQQPALCRHQAGTAGQHRLPEGDTEKKPRSLTVFTGTLGSGMVAGTSTTRQYLVSAEQVSRLAQSPLGMAGCGQGCSAPGAAGEERSVSLSSRGLCNKH